MIRLWLLIFALFFFPPACADMIARQGESWVRLSHDPCSNADVLARVDKVGLDRKEFFSARGMIEGQAYTPCWRQGRLFVELLYDDGHIGLIQHWELEDVYDDKDLT